MHTYRKIVSIMNRENSNVEEVTINNKSILKFTIVNDRCSERSLDKENCCNKVIGLYSYYNLCNSLLNKICKHRFFVEKHSGTVRLNAETLLVIFSKLAFKIHKSVISCKNCRNAISARSATKKHCLYIFFTLFRCFSVSI